MKDLTIEEKYEKLAGEFLMVQEKVQIISNELNKNKIDLKKLQLENEILKERLLTAQNGLEQRKTLKGHDEHSNIKEKYASSDKHQNPRQNQQRIISCSSFLLGKY